jgi:DNA-directed RNA polymerase specialized sigma24 family protein
MEQRDLSATGRAGTAGAGVRFGQLGVHAMRALHEEVSELPPVLRAVTELSFFQECELAEVVAQTGLSIPTVNRRIEEAIKLLRARLPPNGIDGVPELT